MEQERERRVAKFKKGIIASWLSLSILPLGTFFGAIGICAGPSTKNGAVALLVIGVGGIGTALYGAFRVVRGIRFGSPTMRVGGVLSLAAGLFVGLFGWLCASEAQDALRYYLGGGH
jgi:hypothetical protein